MDNKYIRELIEKLEHTEIKDKTARGCQSYDDGMSLLVNTFTRHKECGSQLFFIGNGGSSAIASHMTADFMKNGGMNTYSLYDNAVTTCMGNDYGYEYIFSRPMDFLTRKGDLLVAISSSGNSINILNVPEHLGTVIILSTIESGAKAVKARIIIDRVMTGGVVLSIFLVEDIAISG